MCKTFQKTSVALCGKTEIIVGMVESFNGILDIIVKVFLRSIVRPVKQVYNTAFV